MEKLPTSVYKGNLLGNQNRKSLLQAYPKNKNIKFNVPPMEKELNRLMPKNAKETNKILFKLSYRFSASIRPIDLALKTLYESKPSDDDEAGMHTWKYLKEAVLLARTFTLDALSHISENRKDLALKCLNPNHTEQQTEGLFGPEFDRVLKSEGDNAKYLNDVLFQKRRSESLREYHKTWVQWFGDHWATSLIQQGYLPIWETSSPLKHHSIINTYPQEDTGLLKTKITEMLKNSVISELPLNKPCFLSKIFLVPKKTGELRPVIDLRNLNKFINIFTSRWRPTDIHESPETSNKASTIMGNKDRSILRRHITDCKEQEISTRTRKDFMSVAQISRFSNQHKKIMLKAGAVDRILRIHNRLKADESASSTSKDKGIGQRMQNNKSKAQSAYTQTRLTNRQDEFNLKCNNPSKIVLAPAIEEQEQQLRLGDRIPTTSQRVDKILKNLEQQSTYREHTTRRKERTYKLSGGQSDNECIDALEFPTEINSSIQIRLHDDSCIYKPPGRDRITENKSDNGENMETSYEKESNVTSTAYTRSNERSNRCSIPPLPIPIRMDDFQEDIQTNSAMFEKSQSRSLCNQTEHTNQKLLQPELETPSSSHECNGTVMEELESICQSTLESNPKILFKIIQEQTDIVLISSNSQQENTIQKPQMENLRSTCIRNTLTAQGFSERAADLYIAAFDPKAPTGPSGNLTPPASTDSEPLGGQLSTPE
ncbi:44820_t:CDS:2, partial [Gigaspora margarita]